MAFRHLLVNRFQLVLYALRLHWVLAVLLPFVAVFVAQAQVEEELSDFSDLVPDLELVDRGETLKAFHLHPVLSSPVQTAPDTAALNYYRKSSVEGLGLAIGNNGNFVGPRHYKTFFDRRREWDAFVYGQSFDGLFYRPERLLYYDTRSPYTKLTYHRFGPVEQREEVLDMTLALNVNKQINLGGDFNYFLSRGFYNHNVGRQVGYRLFGSLRLKRYEAYLSGGNNYLNLKEYGGIADDDYLNNPDKFGRGRQQATSRQLPVKYTQGVSNLLFIGHAELNHRYHFGQERRYFLGDRLPSGTRTPIDTTLFVPIATLAHKASYQSGTRLFMANNKQLEQHYGRRYPYYWPEKLIKGRDGKEDRHLNDTIQILPYDSTRITQVHNTFSFQMREGFRPWVKFGLTAYARLENRFYFMRDSIPGDGKSQEFTTYVGGNIQRAGGGGLFNFDISGEVAVVGSDLGNVRIFGEASSKFSLWRLPLSLRLEGHFSNLRTPLLLRHHRGTYVRWDVELPYTQSLLLGGSVSLPSYGTTLSVRSGTLLNYVYFDQELFPKSFPQPIQILEARLHHRYHWRKLHWEVATSYQLSTNQKVVPLPTLSAYAALYIQFHIAKVMYTELGVDGYFHTAYYAPYYDAATQHFQNQREALVGNYPLVNLFASFKLRRVRFFLVYNNLADLFLAPSRRWSLAHMPINPAQLRIGISFDFNN